MRRLPLRLRLTLAFGLSMALVLAGLGVFLRVRLGAELTHGIDLDLRARAAAITDSLTGPGPVLPGDPVLDPDEAFAQVLRPDGTIVAASQAVRARPLVLAADIGRRASGSAYTARVGGIDDPARLLAVQVGTAAGPRIVVVGTNLGDRDDALHRLEVLLVAGGIAALALASAVGWVVAGAGLRPVERIRREAAAMSAIDPGRRLTVPVTGDELARLAETLNELLGRQQEAIAREHRFVDEASHELRTPLAYVKAELDLALRRPRSAAELTETVRSVSAGTDRLAALAEALLVLARSRTGPLPLAREPVSLPALLAEAVGDAGAEIRAPDASVRVDPVRLRQAVANLVDNALRHGGGDVVVEATLDGTTLTVAVHDSGPGFPAGLVDTAFVPFVRGGGGGAGLGLAIVESTARAHGGTAAAASRDGGGATVRLSVPI